METINVLLANRRKVFRESLREQIDDQLDMTVVGEAIEPIELLLAIREENVDVVITDVAPAADGLPGLVSHLLAEYPDLTVFALSSEGGEASVYRRLTVKESLHDLSVAALMTAIRRAVQTKEPLSNGETGEESPCPRQV